MGIDQQVLKLALGTQPNKLVIVNKEQAKLLKIDNSDNPYNPWKLEATPQGVLAAMATERQPNRPWLVTALVSRLDGQVRLMMQLKNTQANASTAWLSSLNAQYQIRVANKNVPLKLVRNWQMVQPSITQAWFEMPPEVLNAWNQSSATASNTANSSTNSNPNISPQQLTWQFLINSTDTRLGTHQLKPKTSLGLMNFFASWQAVNRSRQ
ncbi:hypothetical protein ICV01_04260 [Polynucleobacter sp. MWH-Spelu-300-X4]|uniref:hypothetical protein n=1 Tax=Polynucleobacter sp. MWH-Spelu-300-X4 TaxID=2689109 RepID=UPI001BFDC6EF|nr:hypothetical protein [Polynucleobacter sp. MWH-Spelu-300-X4]QWD80526.1 hypothetical protein ICV01_04260 [Polynucleobacter sp. MWH-Spelu-300-X4]